LEAGDSIPLPLSPESPPPEQKPQGILQGRTIVFGRPAGGARIRAESHRATAVAVSMEDGSFRIDELEHGIYRVSATWQGEEGSYSASREWEVGKAGGNCDLVLGEGAFGEVKGAASLNGLPLPGLPVTLRADGFSAGQVTDSEGAFLFPRVPVGRALLEARMEDEPRHKKKELFLEPGGSAFVKIEFESGMGILSGRVTHDGKEMLLGYAIVEQVAGGQDVAWFEATAPIQNGAWRSECLPEGSYRVTVKGPWTARFLAQVENARETIVEFDFPAGDASVAGRVSLGEAAAGDRLLVFLFQPNACALRIGRMYEPPTREDGLFAEVELAGANYHFRNLPSGTYDLASAWIVDGEIALLRRKTVTLSPGQRLQTDL